MGRSFTADYWVEAAHRVIDSGRTISKVSLELGVGKQLLGREMPAAAGSVMAGHHR